MTRTREYVTHAERAFLQLAARREMRARDESGSQAQTRVIPLECGALARLEFFSGPKMRQELYLSGKFLRFEEFAAIADEIFGGAPYETDESGAPAVYLFVRKYPA